MDQLEEQLRQVMAAEGGDIWSLIDTAIAMAARDHHEDLLLRRESIVRSLYALTPCRNCNPNRVNGHGSDLNLVPNGSNLSRAEMNPVQRVEASPEMRSETPQPEAEGSPEIALSEMHEEQNEKETDSEIRKIHAITDYLEDLDESDEESLASLLQNVAAMDITYHALKQTDIGRRVNSLRKNPSAEIRRLAKQTVRKWKVIADEWAKINNNSAGGSSSPAILTDGDSPQQNPTKHEMMQSPKRTNCAGPSTVNGSDLLETKTKPASIRNGSDPFERKAKPDPIRPGSSERNGSEPVERRAKPERSGPDPVERRVKPDPRIEAPAKANSRPSAPPPARKEREDLLDAARLDSARKRLQENYQEANNAKKQRTVQVMGIHEIPKPKNAFTRRSGPTKHR